MKILVLNYEFPPLGGGGSPVSFEIAKGCAEAGHEVTVVTMGFDGLPDLEVKNNIKIFRLHCWRSKKEICHPWEQLSYLIAAKRFLKIHLLQNKYDICHAHFIIPTGILAYWLKKKYNIKYILSSHGSDVLGYNDRFKFIYPLLKNPWKKILSSADSVVSVSDYLSQRIKSQLPGQKIIVIPNGIDTSKFRPGKKEKVILIVCRLFVNKGVQDVIDAVARINLKGWKIIIVGDGPYRSVLEKKISDNSLMDKIIFTGWLDNNSDQLREIYAKSSIFISASYFESFGVTLLESISAGCYPLVSDIEGHRAVLGDAGDYFKKGDTQELKERLSKLLSRKRLNFRLDMNSFDWKDISKKYNELLKKAR